MKYPFLYLIWVGYLLKSHSKKPSGEIMAGGDALYLPCGWWHAVVGSKAGAHYGLECNIMSH